jgi:hypothetical protein
LDREQHEIAEGVIDDRAMILKVAICVDGLWQPHVDVMVMELDGGVVNGKVKLNSMCITSPESATLGKEPEKIAPGTAKEPEKDAANLKPDIISVATVAIFRHRRSAK